MHAWFACVSAQSHRSQEEIKTALPAKECICTRRRAEPFIEGVKSCEQIDFSRAQWQEGRIWLNWALISWRAAQEFGTGASERASANDGAWGEENDQLTATDWIRCCWSEMQIGMRFHSRRRIIIISISFVRRINSSNAQSVLRRRRNYGQNYFQELAASLLRWVIANIFIH